MKAADLDDGGDTGDDLEKADPEKQLLHSTLLNSKVVQLHHGSAVEDLVEARDGVHILDERLLHPAR
jgi:hypothetical protein